LIALYWRISGVEKSLMIGRVPGHYGMRLRGL
jgi:hypothetical protein